MNELDLFAAAVATANLTERAALLERECAGDPAKRTRLEVLLRAHDQPDSLLDHPAVAPHDPESTATRTFGHEGGAAADDEVPLGFLAPAARPDSLGRIGHYEVLQVLGQGGFGIVFRAFDDVLHRVVAVKVLAPQLAATSPARKRFLREARSSAQVRHENVVQVYEVGEAPLPYIAMEFIPGETLQERLNRIGPVEVAEVLRIGRQVAEGLAAAHATDLIHRDIKPGNILLEGGAGRVKITDFGLARAADDASISQSGIIAGTPMYMAPEQAKGETLDQRADLFSLGSVLYQMAAGRPPFRANSTVAVLKRVAEETPRAIREIIPETPQWLCDIISKLHAKNPDDRYQSAREVADVLADCEAQLKAHAKLKDLSRIPRRQPSARSFGGRKWVAAVALLLPVLALAVTEFAGVTDLLRPPPAAVVTPKDDPNTKPMTPVAADRFALAFDGQTGFVRLPSLRIFRVQPLTVETWAVLEEPAEVPRNYDLIVNAAGAGFGLCVPPSRHGGDGRRLAFLVRQADPAEYVKAWESQPIPRGQLTHIAGVYDGRSEVRLYVNGRCQNRSPIGPVKPSDNPVSLSGNTTGTDAGSRFRGRMSGVRISKVARYDADFTPARRWESDADTMALYHFDEGEGNVLKDSSGNGHHGKIFGAKWVKADAPAVGSLPTATPGSLPPTFTNGIGMEFVKVPKGKSWLGGGKDKLGDKEMEIKEDFYLGKYEVTQEEWEKVMGENPSHFSRMGDGKDLVKDIPDADLKRFPVEGVSWDQCQALVAKLNSLEKETGWVYRLPKETEWEYACRGGPMSDKADSAFNFYFAKPRNTLLPEEANFKSPPGKDQQGTCKVGLYEPNFLGLHDMHGNAWEWCDDTEKAVDGALRHVSRGGSWNDLPVSCRAGHRFQSLPPYRAGIVGLRLARVPVDAPLPEAKSPPPAAAPFTDADVQRIAALPAEEQLEEVRKELVRRNPGFDGKVEHKIEDGVVTEFHVLTDNVTDIAPVRAFTGLVYLDLRGTYPNKGKLADLSPLKGMRLSRLDCSSTQIANLGPLTDVPLTTLQVNHNPVADLTPLKGMPLEHLGIAETKVSDLTPLKGLKLKTLGAQLLPVTDLSPLEGMPLTGLDLYHTVGVTKLDALKGMPLEGLNLQDVPVKDLAPLKEMSTLRSLQLVATDVSDLSPLTGLKLTDLILAGNQITDLSPLKGLPLKRLHFSGTGVSDLRPLQGMSLDDIRLNPKNITQGLDTLREMKSLKTIGTEGNKVWPAAEFWERYDKGEFKE